MNIDSSRLLVCIRSKGKRYPRKGDCCDECGTRLRGNVLSMVAVLERLLPQPDGQIAYDGPKFSPLTYFCSPGCARSAPGRLAEWMTEPGLNLITPCAVCGELVDRTRLAVDFVLDRVKVGGVDADCKTLFDLATVCPACSVWET